MGIYDPSGLLAPLVIKLKLELRKLFGGELGWDDVIPKVNQEAWVALLTEILNIDSIQISLSVRPSDAVWSPEL